MKQYNKAQIMGAVVRERCYQDKKWKNSYHSLAGWILILQRELQEAVDAWATEENDDAALAEILQVVSVGFACLEQHGVVERDDDISLGRLPIA